MGFNRCLHLELKKSAGFWGSRPNVFEASRALIAFCRRPWAAIWSRPGEFGAHCFLEWRGENYNFVTFSKGLRVHRRKF